MSLAHRAMHHVGALLCAVFVLVCHTSAWSQADAQARKGLDPQKLEQRLRAAKARLKLTPDQEAQLRPLLKDEADKLRAIQEKHAGDTSRTSRMAQLHEARTVQSDFRERLGQFLSAEQMTEWDRMRKEAVSEARAMKQQTQGASQP